MFMDTTRISATLAPEKLQEVLTDIKNISANLPFLIDLTTTERVSLPKMGERSQTFVNKAVDIGAQHPEMFPAGFLEEMHKDAELLDSLAPIKLAVDTLQKQLDDTALQVGAEAYAAARTVYAVTKTPFATAKLRTAADDLGKRFGRKARSTAPATPAPAVPPESPAPSPAPSGTPKT
jgi:hypothetical protein